VPEYAPCGEKGQDEGMSQMIPNELARSFPLQEPDPFSWHRERWLDRLGAVDGAADLLTRLPDGVDRSTIAKAVQDEVAAGRFGPAFIATMVWGYGTAGYGPYRTARALSGAMWPRSEQPAAPSTLTRLEKSLRRFRQSGPVEAFRYLTTPPKSRGEQAGKIPYLGAAFITKWLYFASCEGDPANGSAALILDRLVRGWLDRRAGLDLRLGVTADYARYLDVMRAWADALGGTPPQVEETIFQLARHGD
jgi:hypothetical protein